MRTNRASVGERRQIAQAALEALGTRRSDWLRVEVQCGKSHRVAAVYDTHAGLVYASVTGPHGHGARDFVRPEQRRRCGGKEYTDLLSSDSVVDDTLPAWCGCGPRTLSRAELITAVREYRRHLHVT
jgi:hypothetical protein